MIVAEFLKRGINVLLPYDDNSAYDIVIYINGIFYKIQVKTTEQVIDGYMSYKTCKTDPYNKKNTLYTKEEVDYFAFYCIETNWIGLMSFEECNSKETKIRVELPKNNQINRSKMLEDFGFHSQIMKIFNKDLMSNNITKKEKVKKSKKRKMKLCPICNIKEIQIKSNMCRECYRKNIKLIK